MNKSLLFTELGLHMSTVDIAIAFFDNEQLLSKHTYDLNCRIQPLLEQDWYTKWPVFYQIMLLEYQKSEFTDDVYAIEGRYKFIKLLKTINSLPNIDEDYKNMKLYDSYIKSWDKITSRMAKEFQNNSVKLVE